MAAFGSRRSCRRYIGAARVLATARRPAIVRYSDSVFGPDYGVIDEITVMAKTCVFTGKKAVYGNRKKYRGKAKYLGGVGKKILGTSRRKFKPNLQKVRASLTAW